MKKQNQNQWKITNIHTNKVSYFSIGPGNNPEGKSLTSYGVNKMSKYSFGTFIKGGLAVLISVLVIATVVKAGTITPPSGAGEPSAKFYTLSEIYNFIANNTTATEGDHSFTFSDSLVGTGRTLTEIYNALASLISADKVKLGTTYLGTAGTLVPSGGTATTSDVLSGKTYFGDSQTDWTLQAGTMANNGAFSLTASSTDQSVTAGYYSGGTLAGDADLVVGNIKSGVTIFGKAGDYPSAANPLPGDTAATDATAAEICNSNEAWTKAGTLQTGTLSPSAGAILNGTTICGVVGTVVPTPTYGDNNATKVLNTAINPGTYDVATCTTNYNTLNLSVGTVKSGTPFGVSLTGDYPSATYPLSGGTGNDAIAGNILSGFEAWTKAGALVTGTMPNKTGLNVASTAQSQASGINYFTAAQGYYDGTAKVSATDAQTVTLDTDIVTGSIKNGISIFGIIGLLFGDTDASKVLTTADGGGAAKGAYNASNLSTATVKKGTAFGVSPTTGAYSGYPGTAWSGTAITQAACDAQNGSGWYWFADGNGDGDTTDAEDGVCVRATPVTSLSWNGAEQIAAANSAGRTATGGTANTIADTDGTAMTVNAYANMIAKITSGTASGCWGIVKSNTADTNTITVYGSWLSSAYASNCGTPNATSVFTVAGDGPDWYDNSWIGDWTCTGSFPSGAPSWGSFPTSAQVGAGFIALATTDCYDGTRDLLPTEASRAVKTGTATATSTTSITDSSLSLNTNAWVGQKVLITGGTGSGGYGRIESNTGTVITVDSWTGGTPDVGSTFAIIYLIPHATYNPNTSVDGDADDQLNGNNGPLTQEVLNNWKGTRLPTASDFFGFCGYKGNGSAAGTGSYSTTNSAYTADKTFGNYGGQIGRTDEFLDLANSGNWEWLSEQHYYYYARIAGSYGCSYFRYAYVNSGYRFRAVFRP